MLFHFSYDSPISIWLFTPNVLYKYVFLSHLIMKLLYFFQLANITKISHNKLQYSVASNNKNLFIPKTGSWLGITGQYALISSQYVSLSPAAIGKPMQICFSYCWPEVKRSSGNRKGLLSPTFETNTLSTLLAPSIGQIKAHGYFQSQEPGKYCLSTVKQRI